MQIKDVLAKKGGSTLIVSATASVGDAIRAMAAQSVGGVLVTDAPDCSMGIFTERDVLGLFAAGETDFERLKVGERMICSVVSAHPDMGVDAALALMTERRFRHLPVLQGEQLIGIVSIGDLVKARLDETSAEAQSLREYINS